MVMIVLCHLVVRAPTPSIRFSAQFFNAGVPIFFMISGFLFGLKGIKGTALQWYGRRAKRIFPSYYLFLALLLVIYLIIGKDLKWKSWIISILCLQGIQIYLQGAAHLWFLTVLLVCYLITPALKAVNRKNSAAFWAEIWIVSSILRLLVTYFGNRQLGGYWHYVNLYMIAYIAGVYYEKWQGRTSLPVMILLFFAGVLGRLLGRFFLDGTVTYDNVLAGLTSSLIAVSAMLFAEKYFRRIPPKVVTFLSAISFEVYLCHYMLIEGPISMMDLTPLYILNCAIVSGTSILIALLLNLSAVQLRKILF